MRLSDMTGKEVINIGNGARLGVIEECDLCFEGRSGRVESLVLPGRGGMLQLFGEYRGAVIPWQAIRRIGDEVVIVDLSETADRGMSGTRRDRMDRPDR